MKRPSVRTLALAAALTVASILGIASCDPDTSATDGSEASPPATRDPPEITGEGFLTGAAGGRLHYRVLGAGADTVVALHGGPGAGMNSILPDVRPLAERFTVILYDQRGGGRSVLPEDTTLLRAEYFVQDLEAVRRHFGLDRMKLFTHSFGSILAARYAREHPNRVDRMVFHKATGPELSGALEVMRARSSEGPADDSLAARQTELLRSLLQGEAEDPVATCRRYEAIGRELAAARGDPVTHRGSTCDAPDEAVRYYYRYTAQWAPRTFGEWNFTTGLEAVEAPLLVVYGARDSLGIPLQRAWASAVPDGRLLLVPEAGQSAWTDRPAYVFPAVTTFLEGEWPDGAEAP